MTSTDVFANVKVVRIYDGDTFMIDLPNTIPDVLGRELPVRVRHIDTPEMKSLNSCEQIAASKARDTTISLLENARNIEMQDISRDKYFRLLSKVVVTTKDNKKVDLATHLLERGYAIPYEGDTKKKVDWCRVMKKRK